MTEVNDALCAMFGYTREELLASDFQRLTHPKDLQADLDLVAELLTGKRTAYQFEKRYFHKTGQTLYAQLSVSLVRDARGKPLHLSRRSRTTPSGTWPSGGCATASCDSEAFWRPPTTPSSP